MNGDEKDLEDRYVLFFDFLGAASAAKTWPRARIHECVKLLTAVAQTQSAQNISGSAQGDGNCKLTVTPEITTFSDNVVVSYPSAQAHAPGLCVSESVWTEIVLRDAIRVLHPVAERALGVGLLFRGGLSFGQLYHNGDVVFGEAMVDAYELERKHAKNPRVLISGRVTSKITNEPLDRVNALLRDEDGQWHLNYLVEMVRHALSSGDFQGSTRWKNIHVALIDREIAALQQSHPDRAAKWGWFRQHFAMATSEFPAYFTP